MSQLKLEIPEDVYEALKKEADTTSKALEQVALDWMRQHVESLRRGSVDSIMPFYGSWLMTSEERARIEHEIYQDRHQEEVDE